MCAQVCNKGAGSGLLLKPRKMQEIVSAAAAVSTRAAVTFKTRTAYYDNARVAHKLMPSVALWGAQAVTLHGRSRQQRYSKLADWEYVEECAKLAPEGVQVCLLFLSETFSESAALPL